MQLPNLFHAFVTKQVIQQDKLRSVTKNDLFPSAEMIVVLSKEFGVPLTTADFEGKFIFYLFVYLFLFFT